MKKKILIILDKINSTNSGLGRVSYDYINELIKNKDFKYYFLLKKGVSLNKNIFKNQMFFCFFRKVFPFYMKKFDLVHILHQRPKFKILKKSNLLVTIHDLNFLYVKSKKKQNKYRRKMLNLLKKSNALAFISNFTKQDTNNNFNINNLPQKVIYNGCNFLNEVEPLNINEKFIFSIGIFTKKKNFHTLIPFIKNSKVNIKLVIAGKNNTNYGDFVKKKIQENNLESKIILLGEITEGQKNYLYENCEGFVFPSLAEGFGLPIIEAMKKGKPVFCSNKTSLSEIGNEYAYFWRSFEVNHMIEVFNNGIKNFNKKKSEEQILYANSYTWEKNVNFYVRYYKDLLK